MLDVADRHPARIQRDDHVVDATQPPRTLRNQPRGERAVAVAGHVQVDVADLTGDRLRCRAVTGVREEPAVGIALLIADMVSQLGLQATLQGGLDQPRHEPTIARQLQLTGIDLGEQRIQRTRLAKLIESLTTRLLRPFVHIHLYRHSDIVPSRRDRTAYTDHLTRPPARCATARSGPGAAHRGLAHTAIGRSSQGSPASPDRRGTSTQDTPRSARGCALLPAAPALRVEACHGWPASPAWAWRRSSPRAAAPNAANSATAVSPSFPAAAGGAAHTVDGTCCSATPG